ncbi:hypothetical protein [Cellulosimicrobium sp. 22601]|uniref:hypothetical protein n=1 Tax=unclassified Cellulosimicrobium TaxID=2624466 RepID=UPI003F8740E9
MSETTDQTAPTPALVEIPQHKTPEGAWCPVSGCTARSGACPCGFDPTASAPTSDLLPGLELVPPGVAYQVQAAHDAVVGSLKALLAGARHDADAAASRAERAMAHVEAYLAELRAARPVVAAARELVEHWEQMQTVVAETSEGYRLGDALRDAVLGLDAVEEVRRG